MLILYFVYYIMEAQWEYNVKLLWYLHIKLKTASKTCLQPRLLYVYDYLMYIERLSRSLGVVELTAHHVGNIQFQVIALFPENINTEIFEVNYCMKLKRDKQWCFRNSSSIARINLMQLRFIVNNLNLRILQLMFWKLLHIP